MMRDGLIRIIVTLNFFDLLIEQAIRDLGIEPTVISTPAGVAGMEPLHTQGNLVWHVHGVYTNPETQHPDELRDDDQPVNNQLDELFGQYGQLIVGWSAKWDPALGGTRGDSRPAWDPCGPPSYPRPECGRRRSSRTPPEER